MQFRDKLREILERFMTDKIPLKLPLDQRVRDINQEIIGLITEFYDYEDKGEIEIFLRGMKNGNVNLDDVVSIIPDVLLKQYGIPKIEKIESIGKVVRKPSQIIKQRKLRKLFLGGTNEEKKRSVSLAAKAK